MTLHGAPLNQALRGADRNRTGFPIHTGRTRTSSRQTGIYFIQEEDGPVKIGRADYPASRLASMQSGNPRELHMLGWFEAPAEVERQLHSLLSQYRIRGEWFEPHAVVFAALEECLEIWGAPDCSACMANERRVASGFDPDTRASHTCGKSPVRELQ